MCTLSNMHSNMYDRRRDPIFTMYSSCDEFILIIFLAVAVADGVRCGEGRACKNSSCVSISLLSTPPCPQNCTGNSVCTQKRTCHLLSTQPAQGKDCGVQGQLHRTLLILLPFYGFFHACERLFVFFPS